MSDAPIVAQRKHALQLQEVSTAASVTMAAVSVVQLLGAPRPQRGSIEMAHSIVKAREAHKNMRRRIAAEVEKREHTFTAFLVAGATGVYEARNKPLEVMGLDGTLVYGFGALLAGEYVGGRGGRICQSVADGLLSIAAYKYGKAFGKAGVPAVGDAGADARAMDALFAAS